MGKDQLNTEQQNAISQLAGIATEQQASQAGVRSGLGQLFGGNPNTIDPVTGKPQISGIFDPNNPVAGGNPFSFTTPETTLPGFVQGGVQQGLPLQNPGADGEDNGGFDFTGADIQNDILNQTGDLRYDVNNDGIVDIRDMQQYVAQGGTQAPTQNLTASPAQGQAPSQNVVEGGAVRTASSRFGQAGRQAGFGAQTIIEPGPPDPTTTSTPPGGEDIDRRFGQDQLANNLDLARNSGALAEFLVGSETSPFAEVKRFFPGEGGLNTAINQRASQDLANSPTLESLTGDLTNRVVSQVNQNAAARGAFGGSANREDIAGGLGALNLDIANTAQNFRNQNLQNAQNVSGQQFGQGLQGFGANLGAQGQEAQQALQAQAANQNARGQSFQNRLGLLGAQQGIQSQLFGQGLQQAGFNTDLFFRNLQTQEALRSARQQERQAPLNAALAFLGLPSGAQAAGAAGQIGGQGLRTDPFGQLLGTAGQVGGAFIGR